MTKRQGFTSDFKAKAAPKIAEIRYHIAVAFHRLGRDEDASEAHALWRRLSGG